MNVNKMAQVDAQRWAAAEMAYGEGAGTRRRLLDAELSSRWDIPGYYEAWEKAYNNLDMNKFAKLAIKERKNLDRTGFLRKNIRAAVRGDIRNVSPSFLIVGIAAYYAHLNEWDKSALQRAKVEYRVARNGFNRWRKTSDSPLANLFYREPKDDPAPSATWNVIDLDKPYGGQ